MFRAEDYLKNIEKDQLGIWAYPSDNIYDSLPTAGIKVHISAIPQNSEYIFKAVYPFLQEKNLLFKVLVSDQILMRENSGEFGYSQLGKFITIYPKSENELVSIVPALHILTIGFSSIRIPSDCRYTNDSIIYYRYGEFKSDENFIDNRLSTSTTKTLIPDDLKYVQKELTIIKEFTPIKCIRARGKSCVYLGIMNCNRKIVIIKMWNHIGEGLDYSGFELFKHEYKLLKSCEKLDSIPNMIDSFYYRDCYVIVEENMTGHLLQDFLLKGVSRNKRKLIMCGIITELEKIVCNGFIPFDIAPSNLLLKGNKIKLIDFEFFRSIDEDSPTYNFGTPGFMHDNVQPSRQFIFSLAMIDYYLQDSVQYKTLLETNEVNKDTKDYVYNKFSFILSKENAVSLEDCLRKLKEYIEEER